MKNATTTKKEYEYYRLAKEAIDRGEAENALFNIRKALERVVKVLCGQCNIDTYKVDLCDLIQKIREANMIDEKEEALLHRIRIKSNCGVHAQEETEREATIDDAEECLHLLNQVLKAFEGKLENTEKIETAKKNNNVPMRNPDYYSPNRRYYGMWYNCYTKPDLMRIPEYVDLNNKANKGDIQAMLDIAVGFLPKQIQWGAFQSVCVSYDYFRGCCDAKVYFSNNNYLYDARYYYWIVKAATLAAKRGLANEFVPLKYIATALLEALKISCLYNNNTCQNFTNRNHYDMFEKIYDVKYSKALSCSELAVFKYLISLINTYGNDIISPVHEETSINQIKYIVIISQARNDLLRLYWGNRMKQYIDNSIAISEDDLKKPAFYSIDKYRNDCRSNKCYYNTLISEAPKVCINDVQISAERLVLGSACMSCGNVNMDTANFCVQCGKPLYSTKKKTGELYYMKEIVYLNSIAQESTIDNKRRNKALCSIGHIYRYGEGVEQDYTKALEWYNKAANAGNAVAMNNIGYMYDYGKGVEQDYTKALEWYNKAANAGNDTAMNNIGYMYRYGEGVEQDYTKALEWYNKAANAGNAAAMCNIGYMYGFSKGVERDYSKALEWYNKAANAGDGDAMYSIGYMYDYGKGVEQDYSKALEWYNKAVNAGNDSAMYSIGYMYEYGKGVEQDYSKALEWFKKAANAGNSAAMNNIGYMYEFGKGVEQDYTKALEWYNKAANAGNNVTMSNIGRMYECGKGVEQDYTKALEWYTRSYNSGYKDASKGVERMKELLQM